MTHCSWSLLTIPQLSLSLWLAMAPPTKPLRVFFFPFLCPGHMLPILDTAALFSRRNVSATIITTPGNEPFVRPAVDRSSSSPHPINLLLIPFPSSDHHLLPSAQENLSSLNPVSPLALSQFLTATFSLQEPLFNLLKHHTPDCLVSDSIYRWTADIAAQLAIPRLVFYGPGVFALCVQDHYMLRYRHETSDSVVFDRLPHCIEIARSDLPETFLYPSELERVMEAEKNSYGVIVNSFYELEPEYGDLYRESGRRAWYIGPVSLASDFSSGSNIAREWRSWLDSRPAGSVLYVCFGSLSEFGTDQLDEIAAGLRDSGRAFVWVVRNVPGGWRPPEELENGLVIDGWAPQVAVLGHPAVGGFVTHCGWNSTMEAVAAGVPMIAWPLFYEQFVNAKLVTEILKVGVSVEREGGNVLVYEEGKREVVGRGEVARCVERVMGGGEEAAAMRRRVRDYSEKAKKAMEEGGSSCEDLGRLIEGLKALKNKI